jgi:hypothetical protein
VAKSIVTAAVVVLACAVLSVQGMAQASRDPHPDFKTPFVGNGLTCSQQEKPTEKFRIPLFLVKRAKLKARLLNLLHDSLSDDSKGIVNPAREKEIVNLAKKLKEEKGEFNVGETSARSYPQIEPTAGK